ncbi:UBX domain-containing protein 1 [Drosophila sechellia]|uniref:GM25009 n=2 Tax=melanogaster subgroup TaxID=32351 RepID=B4HIX9_DROSE|nr:UBX domain-containing protein 1 [Drosophila sechellia]XP_033159799.1 UBX domain-containing protein 1 [Drosophila mauritiana]EDW40633.1 GM25009 [Drosophila sechellia]
MSEVQTLMDMGFPRERVEYALEVTSNKGVEPAMEWLLAHVDDPIPSRQGAGESPGSAAQPAAAVDSSGAAASSSTSGAGETSAPVAKSLKCDECGKVLRDHTEVEYHAAKTGHTKFSESEEEKKALTEEEKKAQLALIEEKLKQKRIEREEREKTEALQREKNRIKSGKDMTEAKRRMEELEMKKIVEQRKREKDEEKAARDRVKAQIEADKAARKAREQKELGNTEPAPSVSSTTVSSPPAGVKSPPRDYTETRIQVRLQDGSTLQETFNVKEQLSAVRVFIQMKTGIESPFSLMTTFPRKLFAEDDYEKPLEVLGLVPSAVITMTKTPA